MLRTLDRPALQQTKRRERLTKPIRARALQFQHLGCGVRKNSGACADQRPSSQVSLFPLSGGPSSRTEPLRCSSKHPVRAKPRKTQPPGTGKEEAARRCFPVGTERICEWSGLTRRLAMTTPATRGWCYTVTLTRPASLSSPKAAPRKREWPVQGTQPVSNPPPICSATRRTRWPWEVGRSRGSQHLGLLYMCVPQLAGAGPRSRLCRSTAQPLPSNPSKPSCPSCPRWARGAVRHLQDFVAPGLALGLLRHL